jgi:hypothetical protein
VCIFTAALVVRKCAHGKTFSDRQINRRCVECVHSVVQIDAERIPFVKTPRFDNQCVGQIPVNPPVAFLVGVSQIASCDVAADTEVIEIGFLRAQTNVDVAQALAEGQLGKGHAQKLIQMRKSLGGVVRRISRHATTKCVQRQKIHELRENQFTDKH